MSAAEIGVETINVVVRAFVDVFRPVGPVVDIGSYYTEGWGGLCDRRQFFPDRKYIGCDVRPGPGVDRIADAQRLDFADRSIGSVILLETLEHIPYPQRAVAEAHRVLADDGVMLVSTPFTYRLHGFPKDYWRFTASGMHVLLEPFQQKVVCGIGPAASPSTIFAVAGKAVPEFAARKQAFQVALRRAFARHKRRHSLKVLEERGRDLVGLLVGRARVDVAFYDANASRGSE